MLPVADRIADLSMIWKQAAQTFPYFDRVRSDWDALYREYLPRVMNARTDLDFHLLLAEFVNTLGDGHTDYTLPMAVRSHLPFTLKLIDGAYCIDSVVPAMQHLLAQPVRAINGQDFSDLLSSLFRYCYHVDSYIPAYRLQQFLPFFLQPTNNTLTTPAGNFSFDLLPERPQHLVPAALQSPCPYVALNDAPDIRLYDEHILYIRLDDFLSNDAAPALRRAMEQTPHLKGVIIDLRENIGGMTMHGAAVAKLFISGEFHACSKRTRSMTGIALASASQLINWSEEAINRHIASGLTTREEIDESSSYIKNIHFDHYADTYGAADHLPLFDGPFVLLTSRRTLSAAEDFVAMFRTNRRAVIIGEPTSGTTGTPLTQTLACGGFLRVCSVGYQLLDGTQFIGCGIAPDVPCMLSLADYQQGHDSVLAHGLSILKQNP